MWGAESRVYHVCVEVESAAVGQEMLAARVSLILNRASGRRRWAGDCPSDLDR